jgi:hypothetical protein
MLNLMKRRVAALLRLLKSGLFWMVVGTFVFIFSMNQASSIHLSKKDVEKIEAERELEGEDPGPPMSSFECGFFTASIVGGFWLTMYHQMNPRDTSERKSQETIESSPNMGIEIAVSYVQNPRLPAGVLFAA